MDSVGNTALMAEALTISSIASRLRFPGSGSRRYLICTMPNLGRAITHCCGCWLKASRTGWGRSYRAWRPVSADRPWRRNGYAHRSFRCGFQFFMKITDMVVYILAKAFIIFLILNNARNHLISEYATRIKTKQHQYIKLFALDLLLRYFNILYTHSNNVSARITLITL